MCMFPALIGDVENMSREEWMASTGDKYMLYLYMCIQLSMYVIHIFVYMCGFSTLLSLGTWRE